MKTPQFKNPGLSRIDLLASGRSLGFGLRFSPKDGHYAYKLTTLSDCNTNFL